MSIQQCKKEPMAKKKKWAEKNKGIFNRECYSILQYVDNLFKYLERQDFILLQNKLVLCNSTIRWQSLQVPRTQKQLVL